MLAIKNLDVVDLGNSPKETVKNNFIKMGYSITDVIPQETLDAIEQHKNESSVIIAISNLESQITPRNIRSALLGDQYAIDHITNIENQIAALRQ